MVWYYYLGIAAWGFFILKTLLSWILSDVFDDIDIDGDGDIDISLGDIISFKGLLHFIMGFSLWLCTRDYLGFTITNHDYIIAVVLGIIVVMILYYLYKSCMKLEYKPDCQDGSDLVGTSGIVYLELIKGSLYLIHINTTTGTREIMVRANRTYAKGEGCTIVKYENNKYYI